MRLFILGATGKTGTELVDLALKRGHQVTAFVRSPEKITVVNKGLTVIQGSPGDVDGMTAAMKGQDAVFSVLGPKPKETFIALEKRTWTLEDFAAKTLTAMKQAGVPKLVILSSAGQFPGQNLFVRFLSFLARHHMEDMRRMDKAVSESSVDWTIARPNWLAKGPDEKYRSQANALPPKAHKMSFRALASFMLDTVEGGSHARLIVGLGS